MSRDQLLDALAEMWEQRDPVPEELVQRILIALTMDDLDVQYELLELTSRLVGLAGARSEDEAITFTFDSADLSMVLRVSSTGGDTCRVDGWITPARELTVTATQAGVAVQAHVLDQGRFEFPELRSGATRFLLHPEASTPHLITPAVDL
jgi:hypothetical protein